MVVAWGGGIDAKHPDRAMLARPAEHTGGCVATRCQAQILPTTQEDAYDR